MHPTTPVAVHRRRPAGLARASLGTAARTGQHRPGIARVIAGHLLRLRLTGAGVDAGSPTIVIAGLCASARADGDAAALSGAVWPGACVTLPTIAWLPSLTDTCSVALERLSGRAC
jgi:hypothetical protein